MGRRNRLLVGACLVVGCGTILRAIWRVGAAPEPLQAAALTSEAQLEDMIVARPPPSCMTTAC